MDVAFGEAGLEVTQGSTNASDIPVAEPSTRKVRWPIWVSYGALGWTLAYSALSVYWTLGGVGFPFGSAHDPDAALSIFAHATRARSAPVMTLLGLAGVAGAAAMLRARSSFRLGLLAVAWGTAAFLALVVPDYRVLVAVAYTPIVVLGAPFGWPPHIHLIDAYPWPVVNQFVCMVGGLLWAAMAVAYGRRTSGACANCGRRDAENSWTTPAAAARWGWWAVAVAVTVPLLYAATRWAWALGLRLGISEAFYRKGQAMGLWWAGAALATMAVGGALLTLGLTQKWGELFPRWLPYLRGRRVPILLAVIPAAIVAALVTTAGLMFVRMALTSTLGGVFGDGGELAFTAENWAALAPELVWPLWGLALGAATLAYVYRRRGRCPYCGRS